MAAAVAAACCSSAAVFHRSFRTHQKPTPTHLRRRLLRAAADDGGDDIDLTADKPREECGVVGIIGDAEASRLCCLALHALQHRGQEGAGIVSSDGSTLRSVTGLGLVSDVFTPSNLSSLPGSSAIGHVRYSTSGAAAAPSPANVQPFLTNYLFGQAAVAHNGNLTNYLPLRRHLELSGSIFTTSSDTEVLLHLLARSRSRPFLARIVDACETIRGAYSLLFLTPSKLFAARDPRGFRPLVLGRLRRPSRAIVLASETCALDLIDADYHREVLPGEVIAIDGTDLSLSSLCLIPKQTRKACVFELIYFSVPNSIVFSHPVYKSRESFGQILAHESPAPGADVVIPVPDSGYFAAQGFSRQSGIPFQQGLIRSHYVGRTFIQPTQEIRNLGVKMKLAPVRGVIKDKSVVVVDDSIVRGTTSSKIVRLLRDAGAKEVHMRIASPPIVGSCYYGVDTPSSEELISNRMDVEGVRREIGCDTLAFLSLESLRKMLGDEATTFCDACFSRDYPLPLEESKVEMVEEEV